MAIRGAHKAPQLRCARKTDGNDPVAFTIRASFFFFFVPFFETRESQHRTRYRHFSSPNEIDMLRAQLNGLTDRLRRGRDASVVSSDGFNGSNNGRVETSFQSRMRIIDLNPSLDRLQHVSTSMFDFRPLSRDNANIGGWNARNLMDVRESARENN